MYLYKLALTILLVAFTSVVFGQFKLDVIEISYHGPDYDKPAFYKNTGKYRVNFIKMKNGTEFSTIIKQITHVEVKTEGMIVSKPVFDMDLHIELGPKEKILNGNYIVLFWENEMERIWIEGLYRSGKIIKLSRIKFDYPNGDILTLY